MRKPRDLGAELKALSHKAKALKAKRITQLGELVALTGADALDLETLAGALLTVVQSSQQSVTKEAWRSEGVAFFQRRRRRKEAQNRMDAGDGDPSGAEADHNRATADRTYSGAS